MNIINRIFLVIAWALIITVSSGNSHGRQQKEAPWLVYNIAQSEIYESVEVAIFPSNAVLVSIAEYQKQPFSHWFELNEKDLSTLKTLIAATQFFSAAESESNQPAERCLHVGISTLTITLEGKTNKLKFCSNKTLQPLTEQLWLMINQAVIHNKLEKDNDPYAVLGAVSPQKASAKVLQPQTLIEPLKAQVELAEQEQKLSWGLQGLSWLMAPHEFSEYISNILDKLPPARKVLWLETLSRHEFYGNLSESSSAALLPVFFDELKKNYHPAQDDEAPNDSSYGTMINLLGERRYTQAIPYLFELFKMNNNPYAEAYVSAALPRMGAPALEYIKNILLSNRNRDKIVGARMLVTSSLLNPRADYYKPVSEEEFIQIRNQLTQVFIPMLKQIVKNNPEKEVKESVQQSIEDIESALKK